jgi:hypothetical protein
MNRSLGVGRGGKIKKRRTLFLLDRRSKGGTIKVIEEAALKNGKIREA